MTTLSSFNLLIFRTIKDDCWEFNGNINSSGYGYLHIDGKYWSAHRLSMYIYKPNEYREDMMVLHRCNNRKCFNPDHLYVGTASNNMTDAWDFGANAKYKVDKSNKVKKMSKSERKFNRSTITKVAGVRFTQKQMEELKHLPKGISVSILVRTLIDAYLRGELPYIHALVLKEAERTENAVESTQFHERRNHD